MQFSSVPKPIDINKRVLQEPVSDWMNTKSVQKIYISFIFKLLEKLLMSWVMEWLKSGFPQPRNFRNFTRRASAIWDLSKHDLFKIIPKPGAQKRISLPLKSISRDPFQAGSSYVKIPEWGKHSSTHRMPCLVSSIGTFRVSGVQPSDFLGTHCRCVVDIFSKITNCVIQWQSMMITRKLSQVSVVTCGDHWHNCYSGRKPILRIAPPTASIELPVNSATIWLC